MISLVLSQVEKLRAKEMANPPCSKCPDGGKVVYVAEYPFGISHVNPGTKYHGMKAVRNLGHPALTLAVTVGMGAMAVADHLFVKRMFKCTICNQVLKEAE